MENLKYSFTTWDIARALHVTPQHVYELIRKHNVDHMIDKNRRKIISPEGMRQILEGRGYKFPTQNISFQIVKGGVGKTSLSFSLAIRAYQYGARVLAIDLDAQGSLTRSFNVNSRGKPVWINLYKDKIEAKDALVKLSHNLDLIPSNLNNSCLDVEILRSPPNLKDLIKDTIAPIRKNYDLVIMDCPPAINMMNVAATCASDLIIIPINPDEYSMDGMEFTISELKRLKKDFKLDFDYRILWNKYDGRVKTGLSYIAQLDQRADLTENISSTVCRTDASVNNAISNSKSIFELPKKSNIREDIDQFTKEILGINEWIDEKLKPK